MHFGKDVRTCLLIVLTCLASSVVVIAQDPSITVPVTSGAGVVPRVIRFSGTYKAPDGMVLPSSAKLTFSIYETGEGGAALWQELREVRLDANGRYTVLLGDASAEGLPLEIFVNAAARWLGIQAEGQPESRVALISVPYALKAGDAQTLGGRPVTDFTLRESTSTSPRLSPESTAAPAPETSVAVDNGGVSGTVNRVTKWTSATNIGNSSIFDNGTNVGIGTTSPVATLDIRKNFRLQSDTTANGVLQALEGPFVVHRDLSVADSWWYLLSPNNAGRLGVTFFGGSSSTAGGQFTINGDLGVGASADINGNLTIHGYTNMGGARIQSGNNGLIYSIEAGEMVMRDPSVPDAWWFDLKPTVNGFAQVNAFGGGTVTQQGLLNVSGEARATQFAAGAGGAFSISTPPPRAVMGEVTTATGLATGVLGISKSPDGMGVIGQNNATSGNAIGIFGVSVSSAGTGLWGEATATSGDAVGLFGRSVSSSGTGVFGLAAAATGDAVGVFGRSQAAGGTGVWGEVTATSGNNFGVYGRVSDSGASSAAGVFDTVQNGNILIGRNGTTRVFRVDSTGKAFMNGGTQTNGADFAESVSVRDDRSDYQPGDVIGIDADGVRRFRKVTTPYSTLVAGIYSTKPGILATPHDMDDTRIAESEIPLAVVGIVPCKVSGENGPIHVGDLLVTSSTPGYAMKGTDRSRMNGAVVGKALQPMNGATGVIEVLVSLQ